jgi:hypothetical protein
MRNRQLRKIDIVSFKNDIVPRAFGHDLWRNVGLNPLAKGCCQICDIAVETKREQLAIARDIRNHGHVEACDILENHHRALVEVIELEDRRCHFELPADRLLDP